MASQIWINVLGFVIVVLVFLLYSIRNLSNSSTSQKTGGMEVP